MERSSEVLWPSFSDKTKYRVLGNIKVKSDLVIAAGAIFEFSAGQGLTVVDEAKFVAQGTVADKIIFTGKEQKRATGRE